MTAPRRQKDSLYRQSERQRLQLTIPNALNEPIGHDACGIIATLRKTGTPTHGNVKRALEALTQMAHRSGEVRGEGDGCGVMTDIDDTLTRYSAIEPASLAALQALHDAGVPVLAITGRIDLVHCNDSRDAFGSGADRHANLGEGHIDPEVLVAVVARAGAPVVCETPGGVAGQQADIDFLRAHLPV